MKQIATIDRFEGDLIIAELDGEKTFIEIPRANAPVMLGEGMVVEVENGKITNVDFEETERREAELRRRFERILGKKD